MAWVRVTWIAMALLLPSCSEDASEPGFESRPADPEPSTAPQSPPSEAWYTIVLPPGAALGSHDQEEVIDAVYVVPPVTLTVLEPIPRQPELDAWSSTVRGLFADEPVVGEENGSVGSVPAIVQQTSDSLRWVFVADGHGAIVKCFATEPQDRAWLHEHCDPLLGEMSLVRPIRP